MTEALNLDGPASLELIHLEEPRELAYWAHVLSVSEGELKEIVASVGPRAIDVRRHLARARHAEWQRRAHQSPQQVHLQVHRYAQEPRGDPLFALIVCCAAAVATTFGALVYNLTPPDDWVTFQRQHGCEAAANVDPTIEQLRCPDGRTIVRANSRTKLAGGAENTAEKPMQ
jgi:hypothetical protein